MRPDRTQLSAPRNVGDAIYIAAQGVLWRRAKKIRDALNLTWVEDRKLADKMDREIREIEYQIACIGFERKKALALQEKALKHALRGIKEEDLG